MKTAMQELIDEMNEMLIDGNGSIYALKEQARKLLEKEKEQQGYSEVIEFAEWIRIKDFQTTSKDNWIGLDMKYYTTKELFEIFKTKEK